jgi:transglutaminase-like putative cysteine protease
MNLKSIVNAIIVFTTLAVSSQENLYTSFSIPDNLRQNANAVIRLSHIDIELKSSDDMLVTEKRIITVLNKEGDRNIDAYIGYDNSTKIRDLEVLVFDDFGKEIKKVKKNDFKDVSAVSGGTLYDDSRVKYLEYTPISYPYTIEYTSVVSTSNTAFIQPFMPLDNYYLSVEKSLYTISYPEHITIRKKEKHLQGFNIDKEESSGKLSYEAKSIEAIKPESYSPLFRNIVPRVLVALNEFSLEGVPSKVQNWNDFGKWMYHDLIKDTHDLPESTISMIQDLVKDETNDIDKAKKIYQYVQDKTRYISVQVGIGGWKPFNASEVDKLGYGDCKALTNYTMALLNAVGVKSNYCVVYGGDDIMSLENDFASMQGNHVFLNIPNGEENIWLECTSQKVPFGFIADFTDDRDVLVVTPDGGTITHTKKYNPDESLQTIKGFCSIDNNGSIEVKTTISSKGLQYSDKLRLDSETERDLDLHYKERWNYINSISVNKMHINNNKNNIEIIEDISFRANNFTKILGNRMLFTVNTLNRITHIPDRYRNRDAPVKIERGFKDVDEVEIKLPASYKVEALPKDKSIETKFGVYKTKIKVKDENTLVYIREFTINDGEFPKEDYSKFRDFYKEVNKQDNAKVALIKK